MIAEVHPKTPALTSPLTDGWLVRTPVNDTAMADALTRRLGGRGEAEVIALALEQSDSLALIDERAARLVCQELGIQVRGTLGVLLEAKIRGLLPEVRPIIEGLVDGGFWLDRATHERVLLLAGEKRGP